MSRVLVTGGGGFIGRHVVDGLLARGHEVHVASRSDSAARPPNWHRVDLLNAGDTEALIAASRPEILVHLAWYTNPLDYRSSLENLHWSEASIRLIRLFGAYGGRRFIGAGTCAEYDARHGLCSESTTPSDPQTLYGACKNAVREVASHAANHLGIEAAWARVFFPYGPGEPRDKLVSYIATQLLQGRPADTTTGGQFRDYIHVTDIASAFVALVESSKTGIFNVGTGIPVSVAHIAQTMGRLLEAPDLIRLGARASRDETPLLIADIRKSRSELNWQPTISLEEGLEKTIEALGSMHGKWS